MYFRKIEKNCFPWNPCRGVIFKLVDVTVGNRTWGAAVERRTKNELIRESPFVIRNSFVNENQVSHSRRKARREISRRTRMRMKRALGSQGFSWRMITSYCNWLRLREILKEGVNKSNHPIQNPLLLFTESRTRDSIKQAILIYKSHKRYRSFNAKTKVDKYMNNWRVKRCINRA
jgi:hypothetical protein